MKNIIAIFLVALVLTTPIVFAIGSNDNPGQENSQADPDNTVTTPVITGMGNQGNNSEDESNQEIEDEEENAQGKGIGQQIKEIAKANNTEQLKQIIQEKKQELQQEIEQLKEQKREMHQNQNRVRLAVHSLLAMENLTGGIGQNISEIAREFNNSAQIQMQAEEKIRNRNRLIKIFIGGDQEAANQIQNQVEQNQQRIEKLQQLMEQCDCDPEVKQIMQEQIQNMRQEQQRLQELAQKEKQNKGLFGWIWKS